MTPKVAVPESIKCTEWIPSTLMPPTWPISELPWLEGEALHMLARRVLPEDSWHWVEGGQAGFACSALSASAVDGFIVDGFIVDSFIVPGLG